MSSRHKLRLADLSIQEFSKEGHGIGSYAMQDGRLTEVEVPFSIPGDQVVANLLKRRKGIYQSFLEEIKVPSSDRIEPRCIHFGKCGGCRWQQFPYERQLQQKEAWIKTYLKPYLHEGVKWNPILPCSPPWQYRNKMELTFSSDKAQNRYLGLILYGTRGHVFEMQECHLVNPWFVEAVKAVRQWWEESGLDAYHAGRDTGSLRTLTIREGQRTGDRLIMLTVSGNPSFALQKRHLESFVAVLRQAIEPADSSQRLSIFLRIQQIGKGRPTSFYEMLLYGPDHIREIIHLQLNDQSHALQFRVSPSAFFQPNTRQAEQLYNCALKMADLSPDSLVYDLYCGTGTLGVCCAKWAKEVIGIELNPESVLDARENIKTNGLSNMTVRSGDVGHSLAALLQEKKQRPDIVLVDPPRVGLDPRAIQHLLELQAPKLIYVSCNPATQAANLGDLLAGGYRLKEVQPVDQFPQTVHVENIIVLTR
ncbi:23S rRNA (uracil(1939)-C(5))-methyltransferase RlmD [Candidatus Protochlamydia phocaeensis]|uniref:23S rRNA (uracil(1939)-C(5))-methyltransferase RlmD n=1 Tax=Candidatus Protochlamydia phocaeensis TaxID=1414722 RepID=UPI000837AC25|nr:23S rRNA (uracil(1939)-C(5))-methyltransferase RlmD [Candidatus Protochlamydia phocaeensis]